MKYVNKGLFMMMKFLDFQLEDIKNGYILQNEEYKCMFCNKKYHEGEIYILDERFFSAKKRMKLHIINKHDGALAQLLKLDKKYTSITDKQRAIIEEMVQGNSDKQIADKMNITPSTVRHQRFVLKEKAKQAKAYLTIYELIMQKLGDNKAISNKVHEGATMIDERYFSSDKEDESAIKAHIESLDPLIIKTFPAKEKKKIILLRLIVKQFVPNKKYNENKVNTILKNMFHDFATLRRYLIEYGFMKRTKDCSEYWVNGEYHE